MKRLLSLTIWVACTMAWTPGSKAQDCSGWNNCDLRGSYTMTGSGWIDLSKIFPAVPNIPAGTIPMAWAGALSYNGLGAGTGWVTVNAGGMLMNIDFADLSYQMKSDCSVAISYSMKFRDLGVTIGPVYRLAVLAVGPGNPGGPASLELNGIQIGHKPGDPVDLMTMHRISVQYK